MDKNYQFTRLLCELFAVGFTEEQQDSLCISMDLTWGEIEEIYQYAEIEYERIKDDICLKQS